MSSSYYALFHLLVYEASKFMIAGRGDIGLRRSFCRAFKHGDMKKAAQAFASGSAKAVYLSGGVAPQPELVEVTEAFVELQQARHEADYDLSKRFTRTEVRDLLDQVHQAFASWETVRRSPQGRAFLVSLLSFGDMR